MAWPTRHWDLTKEITAHPQVPGGLNEVEYKVLWHGKYSVNALLFSDQDFWVEDAGLWAFVLWGTENLCGSVHKCVSVFRYELM